MCHKFYDGYVRRGSCEKSDPILHLSNSDCCLKVLTVAENFDCRLKFPNGSSKWCIASLSLSSLLYKLSKIAVSSDYDSTAKFGLAY